MTRAEHRLIVLTEKGDESPYLYALRLNEFDRMCVDESPKEIAELGPLAKKIQNQIARHE